MIIKTGTIVQCSRGHACGEMTADTDTHQGIVGQAGGKPPFKRPPWWCSRLVVSGLCGMISLAIVAPTWGAESKFDGVYIGKRVLTKGSNQTCPTEDDVSVTIRGEALTFTNSRLHNFTIGFEPHPDGSFNEISAGDEGGYVTIQGRIVGDAIEADVADSVCEHHWHLVRTGSP